MSLDEGNAKRSTGPWMLWIRGLWGAGKHARNDFDVAVWDLGQPPPPDEDEHLPETTGAKAGTFIPPIEEDEVPACGLEVRLGSQIIRPAGEHGEADVRDA